MTSPEKPTRNWRGYLKEYAIIVIGVLTALGAQQAAEWWQWRSQVAEARTVIGNELAVVMAQGIERVRVQRCIEQRLDALAIILDQATHTGTLPPVPQIGQPNNRPWPEDVWQTTVSSETAAHFPQVQLNRMGVIYAQVTMLRENNRAEQLAWADLSTMTGPGRRLDPASDAALRTAISQARYYNRIMALAGGQAARNIYQLGLPYGPVPKVLVDAAQNRHRTADICKLLSGPAPATYGQAQLYNTLNTFRDWQKYPPYTQPAR